MSGDPTNIDEFVEDLKKDKKIIDVERKGDMLFLLEKSDDKAVKFINPKIIFTKPVIIDREGVENWEIASWEKKEIDGFLEKVEKQFEEYKLLKLKQVKIDNVFFPRLMPNLTDLQKRAVEVAIDNGYYKTPRKIDLRKLAKVMNISLATYQQHLRTAEEKLIPNLLYYTI